MPQKRVEWHLPAKVRLKKAHFGKPPLTECVLRHPPCQSELAEASTTFCGPSCEQAIHPEGKVASQNDNSREARNTYSEGAAYFGGTSPLTATNVATPGGLPAFPYFAASENKSTLLQEVEKRHEQGVYITKKRCAELDGAAHLRLNFCD